MFDGRGDRQVERFEEMYSLARMVDCGSRVKPYIDATGIGHTQETNPPTYALRDEKSKGNVKHQAVTDLSCA